MVWRWLNVSSVAMFCRTALGLFSRAKKDVLYDFLKREDVDWRIQPGHGEGGLQAARIGRQL